MVNETYKAVLKTTQDIIDMIEANQAKMNEALDDMLVLSTKLYSKEVNQISYENWKESLTKKADLSRQLHYCYPMQKPRLRAEFECLEKEVLSVPDYYWTRYVQEKVKK